MASRLDKPEHEAFVAANLIGHGPTLMARMLNEEFGTNYTNSKLKSYYTSHKLKSGSDGRFKKGNVPHTKGKKWDDYMPKESQERSRATQYKQGHVSVNWEPVGTISRTTDGYLIKKVSDKGLQRERWQFLHRLIWEEANGPIPQGTLITFKDGNKENCSLENLMAIDLAENGHLNKMNARQYGGEIAEAYLLNYRLKTTAKNKREQRRKKHD